MTEHELLRQLMENPDALMFAEVLAVIDSHYAFVPTAFQNGGTHNAAGQNNGSCKVFAFAQSHHLDAGATLLLFAEHYRSVVATPDGSDHANIRNFIISGWGGIRFEGEALIARD